MFKKFKKILEKIGKVLIYLFTWKKPKENKFKEGGKPKDVLNKEKENPIVSPNPSNRWEAHQTFNPGVINLKGKIHFLYRAMGTDGISRLGYACSKDGSTIDTRLASPVYEHRKGAGTFNIYSQFSGGSFGGAEDPRLVRVEGENKIRMTYTACEDGLRVALTSIKIEDFLNQKWRWAEPTFLSPPGKVHKNWVIFPEKIRGKYAVIHSLNPDIQIDYLEDLDLEENEFIESHYAGEENKDRWDELVRGAGSPPIKTSRGWLLLYHAMGSNRNRYKVGAKLLDKENPTKVLYKSDVPILEPSESYENDGYKEGVVYASGATVKDGNLMVYYGGSDSHVCLAKKPLDEFLDFLTSSQKPTLKASQKC